LNEVLWATQVLLALAFLGAGYDQAVLYHDAGRRMAWVAAMPHKLAVAVGTLEIVGAIGLIVPAWTRVQPWLTPTAALALAVLMAAAVGYHATRREIPQIAFSGAFCLVAAFVAFGRFVVVPF
jgi:uncharacterized membrane protein